MPSLSTRPDVIGPRMRSPIIEPGYRLGQRPANAGRKFPPEPLTAGEVQRLIDAMPRRGPSGLRNRALTAVMWRAGLRVSEATALEPKDVDERAGLVSVLHGKGDKYRRAAIDGGALALVRIWIEARKQLDIPRGSPLFCTISIDCLGHPLHTAYVRNMLKIYAERAGIEKRVHPHALRHTHAYELAMENTPINLIRDQLGHSDVSVTSRYLARVAPAQLVQTIGARTWPDQVASD